jgi:hypothetical protein
MGEKGIDGPKLGLPGDAFVPIDTPGTGGLVAPGGPQVAGGGAGVAGGAPAGGGAGAGLPDFSGNSAEDPPAAGDVRAKAGDPVAVHQRIQALADAIQDGTYMGSGADAKREINNLRFEIGKIAFYAEVDGVVGEPNSPAKDDLHTLEILENGITTGTLLPH